MKKFLFLLLMSSNALWAQTLRSDLQATLPQLLCKQARSIPTTRELWQHNFFETQLDAAWIRSADASVPLVADDIGALAREQALAKKHQGYAYGLCSSEEAWILSSPSRSALSQWTAEGLKIDLKAMQGYCGKVALHYAKVSGDLPKELMKIKSGAEDTLVLHPELLEPGTIGLTCYPAKAGKGPELWSLVPIHNAKTEAIPFFASHHREGTEGLIQWIQDIRKAQGLPLLKTEIPLLRNFAKQLVAEPSIRHPHAKLMAQKRLLAKKKINILGENRVKATTNEEMAWLLWYSPTHRRLLLHKSASALGFDVARLPHEKLLVLVLAKI
ncbi:MAG TPA: hypothetical protein VFO10_14120 [Oligoflexus sp.]|uniref:hypothetical protein n=1 Tax=Oligoflexus sp. TaxID=1971216 RepID=UPI002D7F959C|nr:hypothetical protein [Oligoflexus sp.]HET9238393.1 hypothetical protein [Oligoflexus sp.]